jgi:hypothetical protein
MGGEAVMMVFFATVAIGLLVQAAIFAFACVRRGASSKL